MYKDEYYEKLTSDIARKVVPALVEKIEPIIDRWARLPLAMKISEASKVTGIGTSSLRTLYNEGVISGKHTGTSDNSPIVLHTHSLLAYLGISEKADKQSFRKIIEKLAV